MTTRRAIPPATAEPITAAIGIDDPPEGPSFDVFSAFVPVAAVCDASFEDPFVLVEPSFLDVDWAPSDLDFDAGEDVLESRSLLWKLIWIIGAKMLRAVIDAAMSGSVMVPSPATESR